MSFDLAGGSLYRPSSVGDTGAFTKFMWAKRVGSPGGLRHLMLIRPNPENTGHEMIFNDPGEGTGYLVTLQANWATAQAKGRVINDGVWEPVAMSGSGANLKFRMWDSGLALWTSIVVGQTVFTAARTRIGDDGSGAALFGGRVAKIRSWNVELTDAELTAEKNSAVVVKTAGLLSNHSGDSMTLSTALTGETGDGFVAVGTVTMSSDNPTFGTAFTGVTVTGTARLPGSAVATVGERVNRILWSGDLSNAVWANNGHSLIAGAVAAPVGWGTSQRVKFNNTLGGFNQKVYGVPDGRWNVVAGFRLVDSGYVVLRNLGGQFGNGSQGIFNPATGEWTTTGDFGGILDAGQFGVRSGGNGWWLIWVSNSLSGSERILEIYPCDSPTVQGVAANKSLDVAAFQMEASNIATLHKPTTTAMVSRALASLTAALSASTVGVGQTVQATIRLFDSIGSPWDQHGPVAVGNSVDGKVTGAYQGGSNFSDLSGAVVMLLTGVANGATDITGSSSGLTSPPVTLTVGTSTPYYVDVLVEPGYQGSANWQIGVYQRHSTDRFPTTRLFQALNQVFRDALFNGQSHMRAPVPPGVSVTVGQTVEVVMENDSLSGKAVDAPGMFLCSIVAG